MESVRVVLPGARTVHGGHDRPDSPQVQPQLGQLPLQRAVAARLLDLPLGHNNIAEGVFFKNIVSHFPCNDNWI